MVNMDYPENTRTVEVMVRIPDGLLEANEEEIREFFTYDFQKHILPEWVDQVKDMQEEHGG